MNYYQAMQRKDGRWDYTCTSGKSTYPVGYCHKYREPDEYILQFLREDQLQEMRDTAHKHHENGHATADEARECYREHLLDHELHLGGRWEGTQHHCEVCQAWTDMYASVGQTYYINLCEQHNNRAEIEKVFEAPGEIWSS